jgi:hypothetical protein
MFRSFQYGPTLKRGGQWWSGQVLHVRHDVGLVLFRQDQQPVADHLEKLPGSSGKFLLLSFSMGPL